MKTLSLSFIILFILGCNPRDPSISPKAIKDCYQQGKRDCGPNGSLKAQNLGNSPGAVLDDFSLGIHSVDRVAEIFRLLRAYSDSDWATKANFETNIENTEGPDQSGITVENLTLIDRGFNQFPVEWKLRIERAGDGTPVKINGGVLNFRWSGQSNDLQIYVIEKSKTFVMTKSGNVNEYKLSAASPVFVKAQNASIADSISLEISQRGLVTWTLKATSIELKNFVSTVDLISNVTSLPSKTIEVSIPDSTLMKADPCVEISANGTLSKIDEKGKISRFPFLMSPIENSVNKTIILPSANWKEQFPDCQRRPALDYLRIIFNSQKK